jgi:TRAP-type C4-dicarboxylate transport system substrate-binding protein
MKHKVFLFSVVFVLLASLLIVGCAPAAPKSVTTIKFADQNAELGWKSTQATVPWQKDVEKATNGAVKFQNFFSESLFKGANAWEALKAGQADAAWCFHGYWANMTSLADVITLPFLPIPSAEKGSEVLWKLYEKYPSIQKQFADNTVLLTWTSNSYLLATKDKQVKTMEDMKGMKIRSTGGPPTDLLKTMGAIPVAMPMGDVYPNMEKGVIDGALLPWEAVYSYKQYEVIKYYTLAPFHAVYFTQSMNTKTWNSLSPDVQKQIMSVSGLTGSKFWGKNDFDRAADAVKGLIQEKKYQVVDYTMPAAEIEKMRKIAAEPLWEAWVKQQEDKGFKEARAILNDTLQMLK